MRPSATSDLSVSDGSRADSRSEAADRAVPGAAPMYFRHPQALVESPRVGRGTRVWAFAHILPNARLGEDCNVCDGVFIENDVWIGDRVTVKCGVQLWDGVTLEDDVFVGPNATFTNDRFPRSRARPEAFSRTLVRRGASIGANATILPGITIGPYAMIGAGAVVTRDVPARAIVVGNPGRTVGFVDARRSKAKAVDEPDAGPEADQLLSIAGAYLRRLPRRQDQRGVLTFAEVDAQLPFAPKRFFTITAVPGGTVRGEHAHHTAHEFMVCVSGSCRVVLDDGEHREEVLLDTPDVGLYVAPNLWRTMHDFSPGAALLVLASELYHEADYIRDYDEVGGDVATR